MTGVRALGPSLCGPGTSIPAHLQQRTLHGDLTVDARPLLRAQRPQLLLLQREELRAGQHAQLIHSPEPMGTLSGLPANHGSSSPPTNHNSPWGKARLQLHTTAGGRRNFSKHSNRSLRKQDNQSAIVASSGTLALGQSRFPAVRHAPLWPNQNAPFLAFLGQAWSRPQPLTRS